MFRVSKKTNRIYIDYTESKSDSGKTTQTTVLTCPVFIIYTNSEIIGTLLTGKLIGYFHKFEFTSAKLNFATVLKVVRGLQAEAESHQNRFEG